MHVLVNEDVEPEDAMSNSKYHKCMSEVYFTRALMWAMWMGVVLKVQQNETKNILAAMCGIVSVVHFVRSCRELMEANNG